MKIRLTAQDLRRQPVGNRPAYEKTSKGTIVADLDEVVRQ